MKKLDNLLHELGISKVKLAKYLGVSRQMIYNYLELDDINKWPKEKKVLLFNLLDIKTPEEIEKIKVDTDYIKRVEEKLTNSEPVEKNNYKADNSLYNGLGKKEKELLHNIIDLEKELLDDPKDNEAYTTALYLYYFLQILNKTKESKYYLGYIAKKNNAVKLNTYDFNKEEQFKFEAIMFSADTLYHGGTSKSRLEVAHKRFEDEINRRVEEEIGRTRELNNLKEMALKELGLKNNTDISDVDAARINKKMAEIESRLTTQRIR